MTETLRFIAAPFHQVEICQDIKCIFFAVLPNSFGNTCLRLNLKESSVGFNYVWLPRMSMQ